MEDDAIITINMDKKCSRCGRKGATQSGICLKCVTKAIKAGEFDHVLHPPKLKGSDKGGKHNESAK